MSLLLYLVHLCPIIEYVGVVQTLLLFLYETLSMAIKVYTYICTFVGMYNACTLNLDKTSRKKFRKITTII